MALDAAPSGRASAEGAPARDKAGTARPPPLTDENSQPHQVDATRPPSIPILLFSPGHAAPAAPVPPFRLPSAGAAFGNTSGSLGHGLTAESTVEGLPSRLESSRSAKSRGGASSAANSARPSRLTSAKSAKSRGHGRATSEPSAAAQTAADEPTGEACASPDSEPAAPPPPLPPATAVAAPAEPSAEQAAPESPVEVPVDAGGAPLHPHLPPGNAAVRAEQHSADGANEERPAAPDAHLSRDAEMHPVVRRTSSGTDDALDGTASFPGLPPHRRTLSALLPPGIPAEALLGTAGNRPPSRLSRPEHSCAASFARPTKAQLAAVEATRARQAQRTQSRQAPPRPAPQATVVKPFKLRTDVRGHWDKEHSEGELTMTTEEREARKTEFNEFRLSSTERHARYMQRVASKAAEAAEQRKTFKAAPFDERIKAGVYRHERPQQHQATEAHAPVLNTGARLAVHRERQEERRRNEEAIAAAREAERVAQQTSMVMLLAHATRRCARQTKEEREEEDLRKQHKFKARPMPSFARAFLPHRAATPPTVPFKFHIRFGASSRHDPPSSVSSARTTPVSEARSSGRDGWLQPRGSSACSSSRRALFS
eukprot:scaffold5.g608.t1